MIVRFDIPDESPVYYEVESMEEAWNKLVEDSDAESKQDLVEKHDVISAYREERLRAKRVLQALDELNEEIFEQETQGPLYELNDRIGELDEVLSWLEDHSEVRELDKLFEQVAKAVRQLENAHSALERVQSKAQKFLMYEPEETVSTEGIDDWEE